MTLKNYTRIDSRICLRCGAVAGRCEHLASDADTIHLSPPIQRHRHHLGSWSKDESERLRTLYPIRRFSIAEIADAMNKTNGAVKWKAGELGLSR